MKSKSPHVAGFCSIIVWIISLYLSLSMVQATKTVWPPPPTNLRPIIGVLAQETDPKSKPFFGDTYIMAEYIKYLEMAGARVLPIKMGKDTNYYTTTFNNINGLLIPGGSVSLETSLYAKASRILFGLALEAITKNDYFPIWGTCLGFEMLTLLRAETNIFLKCDAENFLQPLNLTSDAASSRLLADIPSDVLEIARTYNVTPNYHIKCLTLDNFKSNIQMIEFYKILATSRDKHGKQYVALMEAKRYPIYGSQFHPEKISYTWDIHDKINHSRGAVRLEQYFANFFVNEARRNRHQFPDLTTEAATLIENYQPVFRGAPTFSLKYYFNLTKPSTVKHNQQLCSIAKKIESFFCSN